MGHGVVAIIPARGGSQGVVRKNMRTVGGRSLIERAVRSTRATPQIDATYVSTNDAEIAEAARRVGAQVINRPTDLAGATASSESALLHALDEIRLHGSDPQIVVFVQCTSPFIDPTHLGQAVELVAAGRADSAFAAVATHQFLWRSDPAQPDLLEVTGQNHDPAHRPRRQDHYPDYRETGAFYVMSGRGFRRHRHRFFGRTVAVEVPELTAIDIDTETDLLLAAAVLALDSVRDLDPVDAIDVDVVITDFDGVHTDDTALVSQHGLELVQVSRADGMGIEMLRHRGVPLLIVSKETNPVVSARAAKLGVEVIQASEDKVAAVMGWLHHKGIAAERAAYLGNDINDLAPMRLVGWPIAVADARPEVRAIARLTLTRPGGGGAVRELCDLVIRAKEPFFAEADAATAAAGPELASGRAATPALAASV